MTGGSTCFVNNSTCGDKSDENAVNSGEKANSMDESVIKVINKIHRTPPRGRPTTKDSVSRRSRSISNSRDRSRSTNSAFRVPRTNSFSSQKSNTGSQRSDSNAKKRKKEDSPPPDEAEKPKTPTNVSKTTKHANACANCSKTFLKNDSSIECEC